MPRQNAKGKTEWVNKANGTILAKGTNNPVTGAGCSTLLVLDDPNKPSDRTSSVILDKRNQIFKSTIRNRINAPEVPILVIQQRVAADDLSGFLLKDTKEKWVLHKFAAIKQDGTHFVLNDSRSKKSRSTRTIRLHTTHSTCRCLSMTSARCSAGTSSSSLCTARTRSRCA